MATWIPRMTLYMLLAVLDITTGKDWFEGPIPGVQYYLSDKRLACYDAEGSCREDYGNITSVTSKEENDFLLRKMIESDINNEIMEDKSHWIGLYHDDGSPLRNLNSWKWFDGSGSNYKNWESLDILSSINDTEHTNCSCAELQYHNGTWRPLGCSLGLLRRFICKKIIDSDLRSSKSRGWIVLVIFAFIVAGIASGYIIWKKCIQRRTAQHSPLMWSEELDV